MICCYPDILTQGFMQVRGLDMVLSSLTSPGMVAASAAVLRRGGCFIEIGKRCECITLPPQCHALKANGDSMSM